MRIKVILISLKCHEEGKLLESNPGQLVMTTSTYAVLCHCIQLPQPNATFMYIHVSPFIQNYKEEITLHY